MTHHVVSVSSGVGSAVAAKRVVDVMGAANVTLLFADVNGEDEDNYRFLREVVPWIGAELVTLDNQGRTIWDVFRQARYLGNSRIDPCSKELKRVPMRAWLEANFPDPESVWMHLGFDIDEGHRIDRARPYWRPYRVDAPLTWNKPIWKDQAQQMVMDAGIELPALTREGYPHANCGGGCVKAGHKQFRKLMVERPETYAQWEREEAEFQVFIGKPHTILKDRRGGTVKPLSLRALRVGYDGPEDDSSCNCMGYLDVDLDPEEQSILDMVSSAVSHLESKILPPTP